MTAPHSFPPDYRFHQALDHLQTVNKFNGTEVARRAGMNQAEYSKCRLGHGLPAAHWVKPLAEALCTEEANLQAAYDKSLAERTKKTPTYSGKKRGKSRAVTVAPKPAVAVAVPATNRIERLEQKVDELMKANTVLLKQNDTLIEQMTAFIKAYM